MVALCVATASVPGRAEVETASITGRVTHGTSWSPVKGTTVLVVEHGSGWLHRSGLTNDEGSFRLHGLPPGSYSLAVEVEEGAFVSQSAIPLQGGEIEGLPTARPCVVASRRYRRRTTLLVAENGPDSSLTK